MKTQKLIKRTIFVFKKKSLFSSFETDPTGTSATLTATSTVPGLGR
ncbi:hypothetical protein ACFOWA_15835 [Pedobacter lithocola]|uniref:Uncharacterized protein n=1 Tax=Pedobacter lithocola TaxID=1908239 RepID=A0ABV8PEE3_9SPHI